MVISCWIALLPIGREVLRLAAEGVRDLHGLDARKRLGKALGRKQGVVLSLPQHALKRLQAKGIVIRIAQGEYRFEDDALAAWIRQQQSVR